MRSLPSLKLWSTRAFHCNPLRSTESLKMPLLISGKLQGNEPIGVATGEEAPPGSASQPARFETAPASGPAKTAGVVSLTFAGKLEMIFVEILEGWFCFIKSMNCCDTMLVPRDTPTFERRISIDVKKKVRFFQIGPPKLQLTSLR